MSHLKHMKKVVFGQAQTEVHMDIKLEQLLLSLDEIQSSSFEDCSVTLWDCDKVIGYRAGHTFDIGVKIGTSIEVHRNRLPDNVLKTGERIVEHLGPEVFGLPIVSIGTPVWNDQNLIVGVFITSVSAMRYEHLKQASNKLIESVEEMSASTAQISRGSVEIDQSIKDLAFETKK